MVRDYFSGWLQSCPSQSKEAEETVASLQRFMPPFQKPWRNDTDKSEVFMLVLCVDLDARQEWSETSGVIERAVRRIKEGPHRPLCPVCAQARSSDCRTSYTAFSPEVNRWIPFVPTVIHMDATFGQRRT